MSQDIRKKVGMMEQMIEREYNDILTSALAENHD
jgi:hypothetical protein